MLIAQTDATLAPIGLEGVGVNLVACSSSLLFGLYVLRRIAEHHDHDKVPIRALRFLLAGVACWVVNWAHLGLSEFGDAGQRKAITLALSDLNSTLFLFAGLTLFSGSLPSITRTCRFLPVFFAAAAVCGLQLLSPGGETENLSLGLTVFSLATLGLGFLHLFATTTVLAFCAIFAFLQVHVYGDVVETFVEPGNELTSAVAVATARLLLLAGIFLTIGLEPRRHFELLPGHRSAPDGLRLHVVFWFVATIIASLLLAAHLEQLNLFSEGKVNSGYSSLAVLGLIIVVLIFILRSQGTRQRR